MPVGSVPTLFDQWSLDRGQVSGLFGPTSGCVLFVERTFARHKGLQPPLLLWPSDSLRPSVPSVVPIPRMFWLGGQTHGTDPLCTMKHLGGEALALVLCIDLYHGDATRTPTEPSYLTITLEGPNMMVIVHEVIRKECISAVFELHIVQMLFSRHQSAPYQRQKISDSGLCHLICGCNDEGQPSPYEAVSVLHHSSRIRCSYRTSHIQGLAWRKFRSLHHLSTINDLQLMLRGV